MASGLGFGEQRQSRLEVAVPIVRITKEQMKKANEARAAALEKAPEFCALAQEEERLSNEAANQKKQEK
jgi:hypothetical protein